MSLLWLCIKESMHTIRMTPLQVNRYCAIAVEKSSYCCMSHSKAMDMGQTYQVGASFGSSLTAPSELACTILPFLAWTICKTSGQRRMVPWSSDMQRLPPESRAGLWWQWWSARAWIRWWTATPHSCWHFKLCQKFHFSSLLCSN